VSISPSTSRRVIASALRHGAIDDAAAGNFFLIKAAIAKRRHVGKPARRFGVKARHLRRERSLHHGGKVPEPLLDRLVGFELGVAALGNIKLEPAFGRIDALAEQPADKIVERVKRRAVERVDAAPI
jgi:hypothetical protein